MSEELEQVPAFLDGSHQLLYLLNMRDEKKDKKEDKEEEKKRIKKKKKKKK